MRPKLRHNWITNYVSLCVCVCLCMTVSFFFLTHTYDLLWALGTNFKYIYCRVMWQLGRELINEFMAPLIYKPFGRCHLNVVRERERESECASRRQNKRTAIKISAICNFHVVCLLFVASHSHNWMQRKSETTKALKRSPFAISYFVYIFATVLPHNWKCHVPNWAQWESANCSALFTFCISAANWIEM